MKLTAKQQELLQLLHDGWTVHPSRYMGRLGTMAAYASKPSNGGIYPEAPKITQNTIDALSKRGLVQYSGPAHRRVITLANAS